MSSSNSRNIWTSSDAYEGYIGRWSRKVAPKFTAWLQPGPGLAWLDVGCGTGGLTSAVLELSNPASIVGIDISSAFIDFARAHIHDDRADFQVGDAQAIPLGDKTVDMSVSALCLNHVSQPARAAAELARVTRPGGTVAAYVWDYAGEMWMSRLFWEAAGRIDPSAASHEMGMGHLACTPESLHDLFNSAGLRSVQVTGITIDTPFASFDDYWQPYESGTGVAPAYAQSLPADTRAVLRDELRRVLPEAPDGSIRLSARAWAVKGTRPETEVD